MSDRSVGMETTTNSLSIQLDTRFVMMIMGTEKSSLGTPPTPAFFSFSKGQKTLTKNINSLSTFQVEKIIEQRITSKF